MKKQILLLALLSTALTASCATPRTIYTDAVMRVMVDPAAFTTEDVMMINHSLQSSGKWLIVDRGVGLQAAAREQDFQHGASTTERVDNAEKYARYAKLYGAGGIVTGRGSCSMGPYRWTCLHQLQIVDATTGAVLATAHDYVNIPNHESPNWDKAVDQLNSNFPKNFDTKPIHSRLEQYRKVAQSEAQARQASTLSDAQKKRANKMGDMLRSLAVESQDDNE